MKPMPFICPDQKGVDVPRDVLQRVNIHVFKNPAQVMENIFSVTEYLREVIRKEGGDSGFGNPVLH